MNITVETDSSLLDTEVLIKCIEVDETIESIIASLHMHERKIMGKLDGETLLVAASEVLYFECVERRTFAYTTSSVFEVPYKLYEIEERYYRCGFERVAKSCIVNLCRVDRLCPYIGGRLLMSLDNDENILVSRSYAKSVIRRLSI